MIFWLDILPIVICLCVCSPGVTDSSGTAVVIPEKSGIIIYRRILLQDYF